MLPAYRLADSIKDSLEQKQNIVNYCISKCRSSVLLVQCILAEVVKACCLQSQSRLLEPAKTGCVYRMMCLIEKSLLLTMSDCDCEIRRCHHGQ